MTTRPSNRARVRSVDALRGLVVALMIFVNTLADVPLVPWFTQHLPESVDGYSLADMILPWFLFLVGVSLPLALGHFVARDRRAEAFGKITPRVAGLIVLGVIFVSADRIAPVTGLLGSDWLLLTVTAMMVLLVMRAPPANAEIAAPAPTPTKNDVLVKVVKMGAAIALLVLFAIYRGQDLGNDRVTWMRPQWWGILGIIGWTYLVGAVAYLTTRGAAAALAPLLVLSVVVAIVSAPGPHQLVPSLLDAVTAPLGVHEFLGSYACLVLAGTIAGAILVAPKPDASRFITARKLALLGAVWWSSGALLRPLHGYHKAGSSESWALVGAGQAAVMLALFHLVVDRGPGGDPPRFSDRPAQWLADAGSNALLAYLLSEIEGPLFDHMGFSVIGQDTGARAMVNAGLLTVLFIAIAAAATRARIRLRL